MCARERWRERIKDMIQDSQSQRVEVCERDVLACYKPRMCFAGQEKGWIASEAIRFGYHVSGGLVVVGYNKLDNDQNTVLTALAEAAFRLLC